MCTCMYYVGVHNPLEISIYTEIDLSSLKIECKHLDKLLVSASDIKFDDLLGEGIQISSATNSYHAIFILY